MGGWLGGVLSDYFVILVRFSIGFMVRIDRENWTILSIFGHQVPKLGQIGQLELPPPVCTAVSSIIKIESPN